MWKCPAAIRQVRPPSVVVAGLVDPFRRFASAKPRLAPVNTRLPRLDCPTRVPGAYGRASGLIAWAVTSVGCEAVAAIAAAAPQPASTVSEAMTMSFWCIRVSDPSLVWPAGCLNASGTGKFCFYSWPSDASFPAPHLVESRARARPATDRHAVRALRDRCGACDRRLRAADRRPGRIRGRRVRDGRGRRLLGPDAQLALPDRRQRRSRARPRGEGATLPAGARALARRAAAAAPGWPHPLSIGTGAICVTKRTLRSALVPLR